MKPLRGLLRLAPVAFILAVASAAHAQTFPSRNIAFVVPFAAGGPGDSMARFVAERLAEQLQVPVVVENVAGANGMIAARDFISRPSDGHAIFLGSNTTHAANASLFNATRYDAEKDFAPLACMMRVPQILVVRASLPIRSVAEMLAYARAKPGELTYGWATATNKAGSELLRVRASIDLRAVPYKASPQIATDLLGGHLDMFIGDPVNIIPNVQSGALRALAVTGGTRFAALPYVPTMVEAGVADYELVGWFAAFLRAGVPAPVAETLGAAFARIIRSPDYAAFAAKVGMEPFSCGPAELARFSRDETRKWSDLIALAGIEKQ